MELNMKKKLLCCALLAGIGMAHSAMAQSYDDRWYLSAGVGVAGFDKDRQVSDDVYGMVGVGKMVTPHISIDAELWHSNPDLNKPGVLGNFPTTGCVGCFDFDVIERNWELMSLSLVGRYHFMMEDHSWHPYIALGVGAQEHHDGTQRQPLSLGFSPSRTGTDVMVFGGVGAQWDLGYSYLRAELGARVDTDDGEGDSNFVDGYFGVSFLFPIGAEAVAPPPPAPVVEKTCADLDDDGDGVNNCDDKCPGSQAGTPVGPDGCPVPAPEPEPEPKPFRG
jgi:OOP family OmpA-OmpF porin